MATRFDHVISRTTNTYILSHVHRPNPVGSLLFLPLRQDTGQKEDTMLELLKERELDHYGSGVGWLADLCSRPTPNKWMIIIE